MTFWQKLMLINVVVSTPWNLALLAGVVVVLRRCRHRVAAGVATAGLLLLLGISAVIMSGFVMWLRREVLLPAGLTTERYYEMILDAVYWYGSPLGLALVIAAAFVGRRRVTAGPSP